MSGHFCDDGNFGFVKDDVVVVIIVLGIEVGISVFLEMGDGLSRRERHFQARLMGNMADEQEIFAFGFSDERRIFGERDGIVNLDRVVAGSGLLIRQANVFLGSALVVEDRASGEDGRSKKFPFGDLPDQSRCAGRPSRLNTVVTPFER